MKKTARIVYEGKPIPGKATAGWRSKRDLRYWRLTQGALPEPSMVPVNSWTQCYSNTRR